MSSNSEEAAEFVTTVRTDHVKMKEWYTNTTSNEVKALKDKFGAYPSMWKEVLNWPGWKESRKEYLKQQQLGEKSSSDPIPRKRKSRWGNASSTPAAATPASAALPKRFAAAPPPSQAPRVVLPNLPGMNPNLSPQQQTELRNMQSKLRGVNERLDNLEKEAARVDALPRGHRERSPSPPPIYGADGKRKNTRAVRWRERYTAERQDLLEGIMRLTSKGPQAMGLPGASSLLVRKRVKKIRIPIEEHPNYNFIGLIIGPRGKTQKELESKTGCKIAIRGRGSVKEGARGRRDGKVMEGDNEPLHVVISGDNQRAVDAASDMVEQMLVVIDDEKNVHKQQQLRELALLNGTLKEEEVFCSICGEKGHRSFECPKRFSKAGAGLSVRCAICGDSSHPTRDCPQKNAPGVAGGPGRPGEENEQKINSEYLSFMAELDGKKPESANPSLPPPPTGQGPPKAPADVTLPPPPGASNLPPPPSSNELPKPPNAQPPNFGKNSTNPPSGPQDSTYGHYRPAQQQGYNNSHAAPAGGHHGYYGHQNNGQQQQQPNNGTYGQQPGQHPPNGQQQNGHPQQQQVQPGQETAGWDPSSYYGSYGGGNNGGAGGFNWWDQ